MTDHPMTPPPELVKQWREAPEFSALSPCVMVTVTTTKLQDIATQAAQWGADRELEACCEWLFKYQYDSAVVLLRAARRPEPPSLKEQAMMGLSRIESTGEFFSDGMKDLATIRRALEQLND